MSVAAACAGWLIAAVVAALWLLAHRALGARMEAVARACHELRGPITAARIGLEFGSRRGALSSSQLHAIHSELGRATLALEDLAAAPEGRTVVRQLDRIDLGVLLCESVDAWRPTAARAGVGLSLICPGSLPSVRGDRLRLAQATGNLIANAIEHGGSRVTVLGCASGADARIEVCDDGPGLPAPLGELVRRARQGRGAHGRGLAIASSVAAIHGGRLMAEPCDTGARLVLLVGADDEAAQRPA